MHVCKRARLRRHVTQACVLQQYPRHTRGCAFYQLTERPLSEYVAIAEVDTTVGWVPITSCAHERV